MTGMTENYLMRRGQIRRSINEVANSPFNPEASPLAILQTILSDSLDEPRRAQRSN